MKKKLKYIILALVIAFFTISIVDKTMQNDTFFYIPIGERIVKTHVIDGIDHWSFHENLRFTYPGWICNVIMYLLYSSFGFTGIYITTAIISGLIGISIFVSLLRHKNGLILSFIMSIIAIYISQGTFAARNQIFSFLIFELEILCLNGLLERGKRRYFWLLLVLAFLLVNFHDTVYPLFFVMLMPYIAEIILTKIFKLENSDKFKNSNFTNKKYLIILIVLAILIGFLTPIFGTAYTNLVYCMSGVSTNFIQELKPLNFTSFMPIMVITFITFSIVGFTKTKINIKDLLFVLGFILFSLVTKRNVFFLTLIGIIFFTNIITEFINTYIDEKDQVLKKLEKSTVFIMVICSFTAIVSIRLLSKNLVKEYVHDLTYPKDATDWILNNTDYENMRIFTSFNWGSYLELNGIKVFLDSRSGMYTVQENPNCTVLADWIDVTSGKFHYERIFEKYNITHVLLDKDEIINNYISEDKNYEAIYGDNLFVLYERKSNK